MRPIAVKNRDMGSESRFLPIPPAFDAPVKGGGFPSEYCYAVWHRKTRIMWLPDCEKFLICSFVLTEFTKITYTHTHTHRHRMMAYAALMHRIVWQKYSIYQYLGGKYARWPLSRQCEIPRRFAALLCGTLHVKCYSYHARQWWG